ncbi:hypothetical protein IWX90DRAFT_444685 [Phyllosticta citrichinensis]|uniref:Uncharacterized protein n=1 Tax=Phyllosticta citrichinensis TaxID=1130410 RepID=A0ABR1XGC8_9PEZI
MVGRKTRLMFEKGIRLSLFFPRQLYSLSFLTLIAFVGCQNPRLLMSISPNLANCTAWPGETGRNHSRRESSRQSSSSSRTESHLTARRAC